MKITLETVSDAYVKTREEIAQLNKQIDDLKAKQAKKEDWLIGELSRLGLQNAKTPAGVTIYATVKESVTVADWDAALEWVKENECYEYLTKGVNKTAALEYMGKDRENPPPPGVSYTAVRTVGVRRN